MGRNIAACVTGVLIAFGLVWIVEMVGHSVYPPPLDIDFSNTEALRAYAASMPVGALLFVGGAWFIGTLFGTTAACHIGVAGPRVFASVIGGLMLVATIINLTMIPHPLWFSIAGVAGIIVAAWLAMMLSQRGD